MRFRMKYLKSNKLKHPVVVNQGLEIFSLRSVFSISIKVPKYKEWRNSKNILKIERISLLPPTQYMTLIIQAHQQFSVENYLNDGRNDYLQDKHMNDKYIFLRDLCSSKHNGCFKAPGVVLLPTVFCSFIPIIYFEPIAILHCLCALPSSFGLFSHNFQNILILLYLYSHYIK
jgi:hypothetical protein